MNLSMVFFSDCMPVLFRDAAHRHGRILGEIACGRHYSCTIWSVSHQTMFIYMLCFLTGYAIEIGLVWIGYKLYTTELFPTVVRTIGGFYNCAPNESYREYVYLSSSQHVQLDVANR
jgi:hypothetical protein